MSTDNSEANIVNTVAAFSVEYAIDGKISMAGGFSKGNVAGLLVQPAVWAITGSGPDAGDAFIYGTSVAGAAAGWVLAVPALAAGGVKAVVDDYVSGLVGEARSCEPEAVRGGIVGIDEYGFWAANNEIWAMHIASKGGVVWKHPNGAYCYIRDATKAPICYYKPQKYSKIFRPVIPLKPNGDRVLWTGADY